MKFWWMIYTGITTMGVKETMKAIPFIWVMAKRMDAVNKSIKALTENPNGK